jgi:hypothetical protein
MLSIERGKSTDGSDIADSLMVFGEATDSAVALATQVFVYATPTYTYPNSTSLGVFAPAGATWADTGAIVGVCPVRFFHGQPSNPCLSWLLYMDGDTPAEVPVTVNLYGTLRTFYPLGVGRISAAASYNSSSTLMMLWE